MMEAISLDGPALGRGTVSYTHLDVYKRQDKDPQDIRRSLKQNCKDCHAFRHVYRADGNGHFQADASVQDPPHIISDIHEMQHFRRNMPEITVSLRVTIMLSVKIF